MKTRTLAPLAARLLTPVLLLPLGGCMMNLSHTIESTEDASDEQLLDLYSTTATFLYDDGSLVRAQDQAVKALEVDPSNRAMRRMIGWIRLRMGTHDDLLVALDFFDQLESDGDDNPATMLGYGMTLERLGTAYDVASKRVASGEQLPGGEESAESESRQLSKQAKQHWKHALSLYENSLTDGEGSTTAMNGLQRIEALLGHYDESLAWSGRLLERSSEELDTWRRLLTQGDLTQSEEALFRDNERVADQLQLETHLFAATLLNELGRSDEAIAHLDTVVETRPMLAQGYSLRAQLRLDRGDFELAVADLDRFLGLSEQPFGDPEIRRAFDIRAECVRKLEAAARN